MQSRLLLVSKLNRIFVPTPKYQTIPPPSPFSTIDHPQMEDAKTQGVVLDTQAETNLHHHQDHILTIQHNNINHYMHPKTPPPNLSSSKLQTPGVNQPSDPHVLQKRTEVTCSAGLDAYDHHNNSTKEQEQDDDKDYFHHHKPSPLSEVQIADSRKPLARVTDGTAGGYFGDEQVITWTPEQLDTAEESLERATEMFREAARRGVPELPHSRRLRQLRGEDW